MFCRGLMKTAVVYKMELAKAVRGSPLGYKAKPSAISGRLAHMASSKPARVSMVTPGNPVRGLVGITGARAERPWKRIVDKRTTKRFRK